MITVFIHRDTSKSTAINELLNWNESTCTKHDDTSYMYKVIMDYECINLFIDWWLNFTLFSIKWINENLPIYLLNISRSSWYRNWYTDMYKVVIDNVVHGMQTCNIFSILDNNNIWFPFKHMLMLREIQEFGAFVRIDINCTKIFK